MVRMFSQKNLAIFACRKVYIFLAFLWLGGLLSGYVLSRFLGDVFYSLMRQAMLCPVSIVSALVFNAFPFMIAAFAVYIGSPRLLYVLCFCKLLLFGCLAFGVLTAYGSAGWLVRQMLQFSDLCLLPVLYWFVSSHIKGERAQLLRDLLICLLAASLVSLADSRAVAPFLAAIIES